MKDFRARQGWMMALQIRHKRRLRYQTKRQGGLVGGDGVSPSTRLSPRPVSHHHLFASINLFTMNAKHFTRLASKVPGTEAADATLPDVQVTSAELDHSVPKIRRVVTAKPGRLRSTSSPAVGGASNSPSVEREPPPFGMFLQPPTGEHADWTSFLEAEITRPKLKGAKSCVHLQ